MIATNISLFHKLSCLTPTKRLRRKPKKLHKRLTRKARKVCLLVFFTSQFLIVVHCAVAASSMKKDDDLSEPPKDEDSDGQKLLTTASPLSEAMKWLKPLEKFAKDRVDVWVMIYDVAIRQSISSISSGSDEVLLN
jgi:N-terminal acetyltransferase A, auxiliary subunit